jgi:pimeloyl-ACP methyl ester carboxylesterase
MADLDQKLAKLEGHPQDAINKRLKALLLHLDVLDPPGKWNEFLYVDGVSPDGIRPRYDKMVFAGHSLGAGYAAFVASRHQVRRVIMISNPADAIDSCSTKGDSCTDPTTKAANWLKSHETPADAYHGLIHRRDEGDNHYHRARACWNAIGVLDKRQHVVEDECKGDCSPHGAPATAKRYRDLWIQMLGTP